MKTIKLHYSPNSMIKLMKKGRKKIEYYIQVNDKLIGPFIETTALNEFNILTTINY